MMTKAILVVLSVLIAASLVFSILEHNVKENDKQCADRLATTRTVSDSVREMRAYKPCRQPYLVEHGR